jgi:hypothetical protein
VNSTGLWNIRTGRHHHRFPELPAAEGWHVSAGVEFHGGEQVRVLSCREIALSRQYVNQCTDQPQLCPLIPPNTPPS